MRESPFLLDIGVNGGSEMFMRVVKALDPDLFAQEFNKVCEGFSNPQVQWIDSLTAYVYGEESIPKWELDLPDDTEPEYKSRKCAECAYYDWGRQCLDGNGHKYPGDCACESFYDGEITEEEIEELKAKLKKMRAA